MFYDNYLRLCRIKGKSPTAVAADCNISRGTVTRWKNGTIPFDSTLHGLAEYFGVTVEDLLAEKEKPVTSSDRLSEDEAEIINLYHSASPETRAAILTLLRSASAVPTAPGVVLEG